MRYLDQAHGRLHLRAWLMNVYVLGQIVGMEGGVEVLGVFSSVALAKSAAPEGTVWRDIGDSSRGRHDVPMRSLIDPEVTFEHRRVISVFDIDPYVVDDDGADD